MNANPQPLDFADAYRRIADLSRKRQGYINDYSEALSSAAQAKHDHRLAKAKAYATAAAEGGTADAKKYRAEELAAEAEHRAEIAEALAKAAQERLRANEADRAMLNALIQWSMKLSAVGVE